ncbi:hypothetical protein HMPREF1624_03501 [Sporothrix schenckii ATCC 58251]|uniref:Sfi1 spindle body domain-containing protein n=1 Tax=Sporothrix schenckii (strain ATCC 58251 / de Perez 2211183) TaxID=1391915 RepID=U7PYW6_SPOS1|nr:hypothetical protein HMPREF1624_03501 [Sporothrix schenckii ATCC 58251]
MPSHAPLSSRDGRIRSSSIRQGSEPFYYTNEDIELLHQVVALGQDILPTLPKRDKLPTTALFRAADIVFPRHGLDPDGEDKLSRIIFLVGGMRSTDNLLDRFRTVLGRMGIELEYVPESSSVNADVDGDDDSNNSMYAPEDGENNVQHARRRQSHVQASPPSPHPPSPPLSVHSPTCSSAGGLTSHSGVFPVAPHVTGRRRRNSDSVAEFVVAAGASRFNRGHPEHYESPIDHQSHRPTGRQQQRRQHHRRRSDSLAPPLVNYKDYFGTADEPRPAPRLPSPQRQQRPQTRPRPPHTSRPIDPWLSQVPRYPAAPEEVDYTEEHGNNFKDNLHANPSEGNFDYDDDNDVPSIDQYTQSLDLLRAAAPRKDEHALQQRKQHDTPPNVISGHGAAHLSHNHNYQYHQQLPIRTRQFSQNRPPSAQPGASPTGPGFVTDAQISSLQPAGSWTEPQSPRSRVSSLASDHEAFHGASDTTVQEELEAGPPPRVDPFIMAKVADTYFMRFAFLGGLAVDVWRTTCAAHQQQERYAALIDRELSASEALLVWSSVAGTHIEDMTGKSRQLTALQQEMAIVEERQPDEIERLGDVDEEEAEAEDDQDDEAAAQYRKKQDEREKLMRRAARVFTITTMFNAVSHWQAMAKEEAGRTKVARRHLLRRKVFGAWREQTATDNVKADCFALSWAVRRWSSAMQRGPQENGKLAIQFHHRDLATVTFWTWLRAHQERIAEAWAVDRLKKKAVESWCQRTIALAHFEDKAARNVQQFRLRVATATWAEQAQSQALTFLSIEEQENETYMLAALQDWSKEAFCQEKLRAMHAANETRTKSAVLEVWRESAAEAKHRATQLDLDIAEEYVAHWHRETRLALFRADYEYDLKMDAVQSWVLAEKLAFLIRYRDEQLLWKTCVALKDNFGIGSQGRQREQQREDDLAQVADRLDKTSVFAGLVSAFHQQGERRGAWKEISKYLDHEAVANKTLGLWTAATAEHDGMNEIARRGAFYVGTANALSGWSTYAKNIRKERLRSTYYTFRREVKRKTASDCIAVWRDATLHQGTETSGNGAYAMADQLRYEYEAYTVFTTLNHWILATNDCIFQHTVAAEADTEVYLSLWRLQLADCEELGAAAAEHDTVTKLAGRWDDWELQAVQARGREHTAAALLEKNERRLGRRVLAVWQQELVDRLYVGSAEPEDDLRLSYTASAASRWQGEKDHGAGPSSSFWRLGASFSSPLVGRSDAPRPTPSRAPGSDDRNDRPPRVALVGARPASLLLHPITETPVTTTAQRPFYSGGVLGAVGGSHSVPAPGIVAAESVTTTDVIQQPPTAGTKPLRRLHRSTTAVSYRHQEQAQPTPTALPSSSSPETAVSRVRASPYNHRLLQRRLLSAARLADSVQLGPMSEFDEVEAGAEDAETDPLPLRDYADADVSSEGDDDLGLGPDSPHGLPDRRNLQLLSPTAAHAAHTPTKHLFRPGSSELTAIAAPSSLGTPQSRPAPPPIQPHSDLRSSVAATTGGGIRHSISSLPAPADPRLPSFRPGHSLLQKSAVVGAAAASGAEFPPKSSSFDPVTTTPMGPLPSPFERRLRAAYGDRSGDGLLNVVNVDALKDSPVPLVPLDLTPRQLPLRTSLAASTAPATGRRGARVTFVDVDRKQMKE